MGHLVVKLNIHVLPKTTAIIIAIGLGITEGLRKTTSDTTIIITDYRKYTVE